MAIRTILRPYQVPGGTPAPHYLRATIEPAAHLTLNARINSVATTTLVDSGATGVFMHQNFARDCGAEVKRKLVPREVRVIDGRVINSGLITYEATVQLEVGDHREVVVADITNTGRYSCILGTSWLVRHDPTIRWSLKEVIFESEYCQGNCLKSTRRVQGSMDVDASTSPRVLRDWEFGATTDVGPPDLAALTGIEVNRPASANSGKGRGATGSPVAWDE